MVIDFMSIDLENCTYDYLPNDKNIHLYQHKKMFRMNSDTVLLGNFIQIPNDSIVLDIGTNNGVLLLYASNFHYQKLVGVDICQEAITLAQYNLEMNHISNYELFAQDIFDFSYDTLFDVIICNPPYFSHSTQSNNSSLMNAKHNLHLTLQNLFQKVKQLLKPQGSFFLIHRLSSLNEIKTIINQLDLYIYNQKIVENSKTKPTILLEIKHSFVANVK